MGSFLQTNTCRLSVVPTAARRYALRAVDEQGRADSREVTVELVP